MDGEEEEIIGANFSATDDDADLLDDDLDIEDPEKLPLGDDEDDDPDRHFH
jgi:hypothetical protein